MKVEGDAKVRDELKRLSVAVPAAFGAALYTEGVGLYGDARKRVPVDTGYLRDSAYVTRPNLKSQNMVVEVGFGAEHATLQHQNEAYRHPKGEAKYLQKAMDAFGPGFLQRLGTGTARNVQAGVATVTAVVPGRKGSRRKPAGRLSRASRAAARRRR